MTRQLYSAALPLVLLCLGSLAGTSASGSTLTSVSGGTPVSPVSLTAATSGPVIGYFLGASAGDTDYIALLDVTTGVMSSDHFPNQTTPAGSYAAFGSVHAGDVLEPVLFNSNTGDRIYPGANNADGDAHARITPFFGGLIGSVDYPAGVYVGFEDLLKSQGSDFDYNDDTFVFTNVHGAFASNASAPEPASLALLGTGALGAVALLRRRVR